MALEIRKNPDSSEFFVIDHMAYEFIDARGEDPTSCIFQPMRSEKVKDIDKISAEEADPLAKRGFIVYIFRDMLID